MVDQTYSGLLGLQLAASYQPTPSTRRTALDALLADLRFLVANLASVPAAEAAPAPEAEAAASAAHADVDDDADGGEEFARPGERDMWI